MWILLIVMSFRAHAVNHVEWFRASVSDLLHRRRRNLYSGDHERPWVTMHASAERCSTSSGNANDAHLKERPRVGSRKERGYTWRVEELPNSTARMSLVNSGDHNRHDGVNITTSVSEGLPKSTDIIYVLRSYGATSQGPREVTTCFGSNDRDISLFLVKGTRSF